MKISLFGKHKCPECKKRFGKYKEKRRQVLIDEKNNKSKIVWQNACPHCDFILNEGDLITSSSNSLKELLEKIKGD